MTLDRIKELFKDFGKIIRLRNVAADNANDIKEVAVNTVKQFSQHTGGSDLFDDLMNVIVPLESRVQQVGGSLDRMPTICHSTVETYLRTISPEINQNAAAAPFSILTTLAAQMTTAGAAIYPSGSFFNYFSSEFGFTGFPQSISAANIWDDWISTPVVPLQETRIVSVTDLTGNYSRIVFDQPIEAPSSTPFTLQCFDGDIWFDALETDPDGESDNSLVM